MSFDPNTIVNHILPDSPPMVVVRRTTEIQDGFGQDGYFICRWFDVHGVLHQDRFRHGELRGESRKYPTPVL